MRSGRSHWRRRRRGGRLQARRRLLSNPPSPRPCRPGAPAPPRAPRPQRQRGALDFGSPLRRCTDVLLVLNALLFAGQWLSRDALTLWGAKVNSLIAAGQVWRLLTSSLLHTSLFHLLVRPPGRRGTRRGEGKVEGLGFRSSCLRRRRGAWAAGSRCA
jgi:hypothetical protein